MHVRQQIRERLFVCFQVVVAFASLSPFACRLWFDLADEFNRLTSCVRSFIGPAKILQALRHVAIKGGSCRAGRPDLLSGSVGRLISTHLFIHQFDGITIGCQSFIELIMMQTTCLLLLNLRQ